MSFTSTPPPTPTPTPVPVSPAAASNEPAWAKAIISIVAMAIFLIAFVIAYLTKQGLELLMGAAVGMGSQVVSYWLGSSSGSDKKTDIISKLPPTPP